VEPFIAGDGSCYRGRAKCKLKRAINTIGQTLGTTRTTPTLATIRVAAAKVQNAMSPIFSFQLRDGKALKEGAERQKLIQLEGL
jgi:hypothetical protein